MQLLLQIQVKKTNSGLEERLKNILSKIQGVGMLKYVLIIQKVVKQ